jgi:small redox-active disulfide protein 2
MQIQVLGSGCAKCKKLFELTEQAVEELDLKTEVEYVTDVQKIVQMGLMSSPVLTIDSKAVLVGSVPDKEKLKQIIFEGTAIGLNKTKENPKQGGCSCGGNC